MFVVTFFVNDLSHFAAKLLHFESGCGKLYILESYYILCQLLHDAHPRKLIVYLVGVIKERGGEVLFLVDLFYIKCSS